MFSPAIILPVPQSGQRCLSCLHLCVENSGWACLQQSRRSCSNASPTYKASILIKLYGRISDLDAAFKAANSAEKCLLIQRECAFVRVLVRCWMRCRKSLDSSPTLPHHRREFCCCVNLLKTVAAGAMCVAGVHHTDVLVHMETWSKSEDLVPQWSHLCTEAMLNKFCIPVLPEYLRVLLVERD